MAPEKGSAALATSFRYPRSRAASTPSDFGSAGSTAADFWVVVKEVDSRTFIVPRGET